MGNVCSYIIALGLLLFPYVKGARKCLVTMDIVTMDTMQFYSWLVASNNIVPIGMAICAHSGPSVTSSAYIFSN